MNDSAFDEFRRTVNPVIVSRETHARLVIFAELLKKWQNKINLVAPGELDAIWERHIVDSAQLARYIPESANIADLGSGAGFPGLILSILGWKVTLAESDQRKCAFLGEAARLCEIHPTILNQRIESLDDVEYDVITSRACGPLEKLLHMSSRLMHQNSFCLFLKGKNYAKEIEAARKQHSFTCETFPSITDASGAVLKISDLRFT